jgi:taurine dioxygenase
MIASLFNGSSSLSSPSSAAVAGTKITTMAAASNNVAAASRALNATASSGIGGAAGVCSNKNVYIPPLDPDRVKLIKNSSPNANILPLDPIGAQVNGIDLQQPLDDKTVAALEAEMANRGFIVFKGQQHLSVDDLLAASQLWGGKMMHSTHGVHPATPDMNRHIFRLSNSRTHGILGVGPQWHNDGSFVEAPFSHVGYHMIRVPPKGGGTYFVHQGAAYDALPEDKQVYWERLSSVNSNSGVVHPLVHVHPLSKRKSVWLHLGMTGAVVEKVSPESNEASNKDEYRLLNDDEMKELFHDYNNLLNAGMNINGGDFGIAYEYEEGDCIFLDNYAAAHRASPEAHKTVQEQGGVRIMHRTTVAAPWDTFPPSSTTSLPLYLDIHGPNPFQNSKDGVWSGGGIGFVWDESLRYQN